MLKYLAPVVIPLILLFGFWSFLYNQGQGLHWLIGISVIAILFSARVLSRHYFWRFKILWLNLIVAYLAQLLFLLLITSGTMRYTLSFVLSVLWAGVLWLIRNHFENIQEIGDKNYLAFNRFFYYLSFWFLSTSLYSLVIFLNFPNVYALLIAMVATFLWSWDIIRSSEGLNIYYVLFVLFVTSQMLAVVYFLPVSFYVAGTIATLWFFFIIDNTSSRLHHFKWHFTLFLLSFIVLLGTSLV